MRTDILLDDQLDLAVSADGDFLVGPSAAQDARLILEAEPGQIRQYPTLGVGIRSALNGRVDGSVRRAIQLHLKADGLKAEQILFVDGKLGIKV